jgi:hypothetical protein
MVGGPWGAAIGGIGGGILGALGGGGQDAGLKLQQQVIANQMNDQAAALRANIATQGDVFKGNLALTQDVLNAQSANLGMQAKVAPILPLFNAEQYSRQANDLAMANIARQRADQAILNPAVEAARQREGELVTQATSSAADRDWMNQLLKAGIVSGAATGLDPTKSTAGGESFYGISQQAKRARDLENAKVLQQYQEANKGPEGGLNPGALVTTQQNTIANDASQLNNWINSIMAGGSNLIQGTAQQEAENIKSAAGMGASNYQNLMGNIQTGSQNNLNYANALYQNSANSMKNLNSAIGGLAQGLGSIKGAAAQGDGGQGGIWSFLTPSSNYSSNFGGDQRNSYGGYETQSAAQGSGVYNPTFYSIGAGSGFYPGS